MLFQLFNIILSDIYNKMYKTKHLFVKTTTLLFILFSSNINLDQLIDKKKKSEKAL